MHAIDAADKGGLAASRGTNESGSVVGRHFQIDVVQRLAFAVPGIQTLDLDSNAHKLCRSERAATDRVSHRRDCAHNQKNQHE